MILFCKTALKQKVKVGEFFQDLSDGDWKFIKHNPHLMRIIGPTGGYGIQKEVFNEFNKKLDIQEMFRKNPNIKVVIKDVDTLRTWLSKAEDWLEHHHKANYGDGKQIFLSTHYMTEEGKELWR